MSTSILFHTSQLNMFLAGEGRMQSPMQKSNLASTEKTETQSGHSTDNKFPHVGSLDMQSIDI